MPRTPVLPLITALFLFCCGTAATGAPRVSRVSGVAKKKPQQKQKPRSGAARAPKRAPVVDTPPPAPAEPGPAGESGLVPAQVEDPTQVQPVLITDAEEDLSQPVIVAPIIEDATRPSELPTVPSTPLFDPGGPMGPMRVKPELLTIGGLYYQRAELFGSTTGPSNTMQPVLPSLADLFIDVQPGDEMRGFVRGRLLYDALSPVLNTPQVTLDQFWFRFTLARRVFVALGRQQVRWGTSRIWNPTDFLQEPNPRPLDAVDLRTGIDMLKVNVPWEALASNLWLIATADLKGPAGQPLRYGGAARMEMALGPGELTLTAAVQQGRRPRYGLDWSMGVGPLDFNAQLALVRDSLARTWERTSTGVQQTAFGGPRLMASGGVAGTFRFGDIYRANVLLEGFYNPLGYTDRSLLTWLQSTGEFRPLFFGRAYGFGQVRVTRRAQTEPEVGLSLLANLTDRSYLSRLDVGVGVTRDVVVQGYVEVPFGERGSEFLFEPDLTVVELPSSGRPLFRAGFAVSIRM